MAIYNRLLIPPKQAENTQTTQYPVPSDSKVVIDKFTGTNTSASPAKLSVNLVPIGGSVGDSNLISKERNLAPGEAYTFPEIVGHILDGGYISTLADTASAITISASGREIVQ